MIEIAQVLLFDRHDRLLIYLRDEKADIPFRTTGIFLAVTWK
jgi:hypothetical protein